MILRMIRCTVLGLVVVAAGPGLFIERRDMLYVADSQKHVRR